MAYVAIENQLPGIGGLLKQFPETGMPLSQFAQALLRGESPLTPGERELIASYTSHVNDCFY